MHGRRRRRGRRGNAQRLAWPRRRTFADPPRPGMALWAHGRGAGMAAWQSADRLEGSGGQGYRRIHCEIHSIRSKSFHKIRSLSVPHLFALAHLLQRPIVLVEWRAPSVIVGYSPGYVVQPPLTFSEALLARKDPTCRVHGCGCMHATSAAWYRVTASDGVYNLYISEARTILQHTIYLQLFALYIVTST